MAERKPAPEGGGRLREVIRRLEEARTRAPKGSDATWPGPVSDSGTLAPDGGSGEWADSGEMLWRPFTPKVLERTRPFRTAPPSRDEFESHLSQFLGARTRRTGPLFRAQGVTVSFGAVAACRDVDLELNDGEIVALIGPNGAGKTALCDALTGFGPAEAGRVYFGERDISGLPAHRRAALGLARTFTRPALFESMTVAENLMTAQHRRMRGGFFACGLGLALSRHEDRVARSHAAEVLELLDIAGVADHPVAALPAGIRRLVDLGRVLATEPRLAVLDEPAAGLDRAERRELAERIGMMCDEMGVAVLVTGQDLASVSSLADFVYVLDSGTVVGRGDPPDVAADTRVQAAYLRFGPPGDTGAGEAGEGPGSPERAEPPEEEA